MVIIFHTGCLTNCLVAGDLKTSEETVSLQLYSSEPSSTSSHIIPVYAVFSEELAELSIKSFRVTNGILESFQQLSESPNTYLLEVRPMYIGTVTIELNINNVWAKSSNSLRPIIKEKISFNFFYVSPFTEFSVPSKLTVTSQDSTEYTLTYRGTYTEVVPNLYDFLSLDYAGNVQCDFLDLNKISRFQYKVIISGCHGNGLVRLRVEAGSASAEDGPFPIMLSLHRLTVANPLN